jgi:transcriptional regulator of acetoin/glycerol metabolism
MGARSGVRTAIQKSWERSSSAGIDPQCGEAPTAEDATEIERLRQSNRELCRAARGSLDKIGRMLHGAEAMLILTDEKGLVIEAIGDPKTLAAGRDINLHVGALWNEHAVGTNGIGTTLWAGEPMFVHGSEHFVESLKEWSCAAAPIRNPIDQSVIGAVDLSGLTKIFRHHNTAFAAAAAGEIQAALAQALNEERIRLLDALIEQGPVAGQDDGILILDRAGRVVHRSGFERLVLPNGTELDTRIGQRLIHLNGAPTPETVASALPAGFGCREVSGLQVDGEIRGMALVLPSGRASRRSSAPAATSAGPRPAHAGGIIAEHPAMLEAIDLARRVARVNAPVLVQGETGTGKELFARLIHAEYAGGRDRPFVAINCGAISRELFGGELFGHVHGAFTGAVKEGKAGKLEQANGGVFCLDEIGEMPLEIQPYLLRVLEERTIYRIGDSRARPFDARLVALTNRDLRAEAEAGRFRRDLYYRIGAVTVYVPPLRARGDDVLLLLDYFNHAIGAEFGLAPLRFPDELLELFRRYPWPGNVRELRNLVQRLHPVSRHRDISLSDLPPEITVERAAEPAEPVAERPVKLREAEKAAILRALGECNGNLSRVAKSLGVTRPTLYRKLKLYSIERVFR